MKMENLKHIDLDIIKNLDISDHAKKCFVNQNHNYYICTAGEIYYCEDEKIIRFDDIKAFEEHLLNL